MTKIIEVLIRAVGVMFFANVIFQVLHFFIFRGKQPFPLPDLAWVAELFVLVFLFGAEAYFYEKKKFNG